MVESSPMLYAAIVSTARSIVGILLVLLGIAALLTPLTPGSWLAIIGLQLLGWHVTTGWVFAHLRRRWRRM